MPHAWRSSTDRCHGLRRNLLEWLTELVCQGGRGYHLDPPRIGCPFAGAGLTGVHIMDVL